MISPSECLREVTPAEYRALGPDTLRDYLGNLPSLRERLGQTPKQWTIREVGDGNLNLVFIVESGASSVVVKQALPYVRMVGDSWPLPLSRSFFEHAALQEQSKFAFKYVPAIFHCDQNMALIIMEHLTPHIILRKGLIGGIVYPDLAEDIGLFLARTLFSTSDLNLPAAEKKKLASVFCANTAMCKITEDLIFTEPFYAAPMNRWITPYLDSLVTEIRTDRKMKLAAQELKYAFLTHSEALLHGDLHTGSIMLTKEDTRVIDPEFGFFGPIGFDVGTIIANLLMAFFSQSGLEERPGQRRNYQRWILNQIENLWNRFAHEFTCLWQARVTDTPGGDAYSVALDQQDPILRETAINKRLKDIWQDSVGFAALEIIRRIVGLAHIEDFESIASIEKRAQCQHNALILACYMLRHQKSLPGIHMLVDIADELLLEKKTA